MFLHHLSRKPLLGLFLLALFSTTTAKADEWRLRALGQALSSSATILDNEDLDEGYGAYVGLERRLGPRWGLEFGVGLSELEAAQQVDLDFLGVSLLTNLEARVQWIPLTVAANFHLTPDRDVDFYIAPKIGYALVDDLEIETRVDFIGSPFPPGFPSFPGFPIDIPLPNFDVPDQVTQLATDDTFIYGARLGLDWSIGDSGWGLSGAVDYTVMELEFSGGGSIDLDPLSVGLGFFKSW